MGCHSGYSRFWGPCVHLDAKDTSAKTKGGTVMGKKNNESIKADRSKKEIQTNVSRRNLLKLAGATAAGATALAIIPGSSLLLLPPPLLQLISRDFV